MNGSHLKFYVQEKHKLHGILAYEWLLEQARRLGIPGGSAFRAIAGYGRHGVLHEDHFFELAGDLPVEGGFACTDEQAERLLQCLRDEQVSVFYVRLPAQFGLTGAMP